MEMTGGVAADIGALIGAIGAVNGTAAEYFAVDTAGMGADIGVDLIVIVPGANGATVCFAVTVTAVAIVCLAVAIVCLGAMGAMGTGADVTCAGADTKGPADIGREVATRLAGPAAIIAISDVGTVAVTAIDAVAVSGATTGTDTCTCTARCVVAATIVDGGAMNSADAAGA